MYKKFFQFKGDIKVRLLKICFAFFFMIISVYTVSEHADIVYADTTAGEQYSFTVTPLKPGTDEPQESFYDLKVKPGEKVEFKVRIKNFSTEEIKVSIAANNGSTNQNGITSYTENAKKDESLKLAFSDIASLDSSKVTIGKGEHADIPVTLQVPDTPFEGTILGGLRFTSPNIQAQAQKKSSGIGNTVSYTIGVVLREDDTPVEPKMSLENVVQEQRNGRNYIGLNLQNSAPRIIKKLKVDAKIRSKDSEKVLYMAKNDAMRMAPNSNFNFGISLEDQPFKSGNYIAEVTGTADGNEFSFKKSFMIKKEAAKKWNENAVFVDEKSGDTSWLYIGMGVLLLMVLILVAYIIFKKKGER